MSPYAKKHIQYQKSISWRCHQCDVRIKTSLDFCLLGTQNKIHNHPAPSDSDNIQIVSVPSVSHTPSHTPASVASVSVPAVSGDPDLHFFKTQKGGTGVILNGFRFKKHKQLQKSISWRCHQCDVSDPSVSHTPASVTRIPTASVQVVDSTHDQLNDHLVPVQDPDTQDMSTASIQYSKFGNACLSINNFMFCKHSEVNDVTYWKCLDKQCKATCQTNNELNSIIYLNECHNHLLKIQENVNKKAIRESVKRKACEELNCKPAKIICKEIEGNEDLFTYTDIKNLRKVVNREKLKNYPTLPENREEMMNILQKSVGMTENGFKL